MKSEGIKDSRETSSSPFTLHPSPNFFHIAAGCLLNHKGEALICQRPAHKLYPGEWEFPGGKVEAGESAEQALRRELREELGVDVTACRPLIRLRHVYPELSVDLDTWLVTAFSGEVSPTEHPAVAWVAPDDLPRWALLAADRPIVAALRLPAHYVFTPPQAESAWLRERLRQLPAGALLRLRMPRLADDAYERLAMELLPACRRRQLVLMLDRGTEMVARTGAGGWHATAAALRRTLHRPVPQGCWFGASVHDADELRRAREAGADFAVLGPLRPTATHPGATGLGWERFGELKAGAGVPVYAIGGLTLADAALAQASGAQGIAGISAFWG